MELLTANLLPEQYLELVAAIVDETRANTVAKCVKRMVLWRNKVEEKKNEQANKKKTNQFL